MHIAQSEATIPIKAIKLSPAKILSKSSIVMLNTISPNASAINM